MRILVLHQNAPGQFRHLAPRLAADPANQVVVLGQPGRPRIPGARILEYRPHRAVADGAHPYLRTIEQAALNAQGVARAAFALDSDGFRPDLVLVHPGWGEGLLLRDVWPGTRIVSFAEFYYASRGADVGFDPEFPTGLDSRLALTFRNAHLLLAQDMADASYAPTEWQRSRFPAAYRAGIEVIHDGIDCARVRPDPDAVLELPGIGRFTAGERTVTYVARNLEPYRGFHIFARMLPGLLARVPDAHVLIVGGDEVSYSARLPKGETWRARLTAGLDLPPDRVHFLGKIPYATYLRLLQVSAAHVYLTYPFVLSWSCLEAMAAGCLVIGSRTAPVEEVIADGETGLLTGFFDTEALGEKVAAVLTAPGDYAAIRHRARQSVEDRFALEDCLARQIALIGG